MGTLAEIIKQAAPEADEATSAFLSRLNKLEGAAAKPGDAGEDLTYMTEQLGLPTVKQEMWQNTLRTLARAGLTSAQLGALLRAMRAQSEEANRKRLLTDLGAFEGDVPGRGVRAPITAKMASLTLPVLLGTAATSTGARAIGSSVDKMFEGLKEQGSALGEHLFAQTGKATDNPLFYPLLLASIAAGGYGGYKELDTHLGQMRKSRAAREIEQAKKEFERALSTQYQQAQMAQDAGVKISSQHAGYVVDGLARAHVSGELAEQLATLEKGAAEIGDEPQTEEKQPWTYGAGNKALGIYLATLALLAAAGAGAGYHGVKAHETPRRKYDVATELLRRRALSSPPIITTEA